MPSTLRRTARVLLPIFAAAALAGALAATAWSQRHNQVSFEEGEEGWYPLFDGHTLDGWTIQGNADWKAVDGEIVSGTGGVSLLMTDETFSDFELRADFLAAKGTNSGIFVRITGKAVAPGLQAYELNIAPPDNAHPTGSLMHITAAEGGKTDFGASLTVDAEESEEWRTFDLVANGNKFTVSIDGKPLGELVDSTPIAEGYIGLQHNQGKIAFRNIKVRRLKL